MQHKWKSERWLNRDDGILVLWRGKNLKIYDTHKHAGLKFHDANTHLVVQEKKKNLGSKAMQINQWWSKPQYSGEPALAISSFLESHTCHKSTETLVYQTATNVLENAYVNCS